MLCSPYNDLGLGNWPWNSIKSHPRIKVEHCYYFHCDWPTFDLLNPHSMSVEIKICIYIWYINIYPKRHVLVYYMTFKKDI